MKRRILAALSVSALLLAELVPAEGFARGDDFAAAEAKWQDLTRDAESLEGGIARAKTRSKDLEERVVLRGRAYYRLARTPAWSDFLSHAVRLERMRKGLLDDVGELEALRSTVQSSEKKLSVVKEKRAPLEATRAARRRAEEALLVERERNRAFELAFRSAAGPSDHTAIYSAPGGLETSATFLGLRGRMPLPVSGRAEIEVTRLEGVSGQGLSLKTAPFSVARSVFRGRVAFADEYPGYGKTVLLDHGDGYFTVTARLSTIEVAPSDELPEGTRIGLSGSSGSAGHLYFEIRKGEEILAPGPWFGI